MSTKDTGPRRVDEHRGMTNGMKWFLIIAGTLIVVFVIGSPRVSATTTTRPPSPAVATSQAPTQAQQAPPTQTVLGYTNNDYMVGNEPGMIAPGRYQSNGDNGGFKFSTWTTYSDLDKSHVLNFGSIGGNETRYMTVESNAKMVVLTGDAMWIKVG